MRYVFCPDVMCFNVAFSLFFIILFILFKVIGTMHIKIISIMYQYTCVQLGDRAAKCTVSKAHIEHLKAGQRET